MNTKVLLKDFAESLSLDIICGNLTSEICLSTDNVNRPGLMLTGFEEYFVPERIQVLGQAEITFLNRLAEHDANVNINRLFSTNPPCIILSRGIKPQAGFLACAAGYNVPVLTSKKATSLLSSELTRYLQDVLAETASAHGTLMEVAGIGVLITGDAGIGKSETALELVHRGHKLVADDAVIVKKVNNQIIGTAPELTRFFMEVRGIGIIDVRQLFGVGSMLSEQNIDLVIHLEKFTEHKKIDRLNAPAQKTRILDIDIPKYVIPVLPGRNIAIVTEVAARHHHLKLSGIDAEQLLLGKQNWK
jgi:HPr kinase/phosphorylase